MKFLASLFAALLLTGLAVGQSCPTNITACGCTITKDGVYTVAKNLSAGSGLTPLGSCIDVKSDDVVLLTNGFNITGGGKGIGINLLPEAKGALLSAGGPQLTFTSVTGWQIGLKSAADEVFAESFYFYGNETGVLLSDAKLNTLTVFGAFNNSKNGVEVHGGRRNTLSAGGAWNNGNAGILLDPCSSATTISEVIEYADFYPPNYGAAYEQKYGIYVAKGSARNTIVDNQVFGSSVDDLFDGNGAGANIWHANNFTTANQPFVQ